MNEANEQLVRLFITAFAAGDIAAVRRLVHPDIIDHTPPPGGPTGVDGVLAAVAAYREGFPDVRISVDKVVSDGDCVVGYGRITGTSSGIFFGMPPTGKSADSAYIDIYRIENDLITEAWHLEDIAGLMRQIAASPQNAAV
jgi:predicted ester cyclase